MKNCICSCQHLHNNHKFIYLQNGINVTTESADETEYDGKPEHMFRPYVAYFYQEDEAKPDYNVSYAQCLFITGDGVCLDSPDDVQKSSSRLTHIFVANDDIDRVKLKQTVESFGTENIENIAFINHQWILDCDDQKKRIRDTSYRVYL